MYAQITLVGHVGQEPELRYTPNGTPTCNFTIAINRIWTNGDVRRKSALSTLRRATCFWWQAIISNLAVGWIATAMFRAISR